MVKLSYIWPFLGLLIVQRAKLSHKCNDYRTPGNTGADRLLDCSNLNKRINAWNRYNNGMLILNRNGNSWTKILVFYQMGAKKQSIWVHVSVLSAPFLFAVLLFSANGKLACHWWNVFFFGYRENGSTFFLSCDCVYFPLFQVNLFLPPWWNSNWGKNGRKKKENWLAS